MEYGIDESSEHKLSKPFRNISLILLILFVIVEANRTIGMFDNWSSGGLIGPMLVSVFAVVFSIALIVMTLGGNKKSLVLWFIIGVLNLIVIMTSLFKITTSMIEMIVGMSAWLAMVYFILHILIAVSIGIYGWSLTKPSVAHEALSKQKAKDFGEFLNRKTIS